MTGANTESGPIQTWTPSDATLLYEDRDYYVVFDESVNPDCIWVFGGIYNCITCMACYNITDDTLTNYDTLHTGGFTVGKPGAVIIDNIIYFYTRDDINGSIRQYDILNKQESTSLIATFSSIWDLCLVKNSNNNYLYLTGGGGIVEGENDEFYIYSFINNSIYNGPSLINSRHIVSCAVNEYYNDPYLYVFGGGSVYIERINLNNLQHWEQLTLRLDDTSIQGSTFSWSESSNFGYFAIFSIKNYIYILGGYEGDSDNSDEMFYLDVKNWQLKYAGSSPLQGWSAAAIYIETTKRAYVVGGISTGAFYYDYIYYSNEAFIPTLYPTIMPTDDPTIKPTNIPTYHPTVIPTTYDPTTNPTVQPTISPTLTTVETATSSVTPFEQSERSATSKVDPEATSTTVSNNGELSDSSSEDINISDSVFIAILVSGVIAVCCMIILCMFSIFMCVWIKQHNGNVNINTKQRTSRQNNDNNCETQMGNQLFSHNKRNKGQDIQKSQLHMHVVMNSNAHNENKNINKDDINNKSQKEQRKQQQEMMARVGQPGINVASYDMEIQQIDGENQDDDHDRIDELYLVNDKNDGVDGTDTGTGGGGRDDKKIESIDKDLEVALKYAQKDDARFITGEKNNNVKIDLEGN